MFVGHVTNLAAFGHREEQAEQAADQAQLSMKKLP